MIFFDNYNSDVEREKKRGEFYQVGSGSTLPGSATQPGGGIQQRKERLTHISNSATLTLR